MRYPTPLLPGRLIQRYKRFLADVQLDDGRTVTAHVANSGSMLGLKQPGSRVWLLEKPGTKLGWSWELIEVEMAGAPALVGVNTSHPNRIAEAAIGAGMIPELTGYDTIRREVRYGENSRIDLLLESPGKRAFVEIKNVHMWRTGVLAEFPDAVTARGAKHLRELAREVQGGARGVMLYVIQGPADGFSLAADIDPAYAAAFMEARLAGVEAYAYSCALTTGGIDLHKAVPVHV